MEKIKSSVTEIWKPVQKYPRFIEVSTHGRVRDKIKIQKNKSDIYLTRITSKHYDEDVVITVPYVSDSPKIKVKHLVAEAFLEKRPSPNHELIQMDNDKENCHVHNLKWCLKKEDVKVVNEMNTTNENLLKEIETLKQQLKQEQQKYDCLFKAYTELKMDKQLNVLNQTDVLAMMFDPTKYDLLKYKEENGTELLDFPTEPLERAKLAQTYTEYEWFSVVDNDMTNQSTDEKEDDTTDKNAIIVSLADLPMYFKYRRYIDKITTTEANALYDLSFSVYEQGQKPSEKMVSKINNKLNITINMKDTSNYVDDSQDGFAKRLSETLLQKNITIEQLSKRSNIDASSIRQYVKNIHRPRTNSDTVEKLARALNITQAYLITGSNIWGKHEA